MPQTQLETRNQKLKTDLRELAQDIVRRAMAGGATAAECVVREGDEFSTLVRLGQVETSEGIRLPSHRRAGLSRPACGQHLFQRLFPRSAGPHGEVRAGAGEDYLGRSLRRHSGGLATRLAPRRSRSLFRRRLLASRRRAHRLRAPRREGRARLRSAHQELRRRFVRRRHRPQSPGQLARIRRRISALLLLRGGGAHRAVRERRHAARLLVLGGAQPGPAGVSGSRSARLLPSVRCGVWARAR